ncbi:Predicted kinase [Mycolicibacterium fluoranthenivorans]|uniref:Predicted kinase n=1 Tax=Mycolicibacterium fluoranthenivorans TaxID=258505 RepID=A0A1G4VVG5_9MYCO|nr:Predicted kinase [Mycolicibacterium fluoranthenivorans]
MVIGGLPGTGKTSIATLVARRVHATYLRIDTIEQALADSGELPRPPVTAGYRTGYAVARDQLRLGHIVVAECVNPLRLSRDAWYAVATESGCWAVEVELVCSDSAEHRRRVETRVSDIPGLVLPSWPQVLERVYEPWHRDHLVIDTAVSSIAEAAGRIVRETEDPALRK